MHEIQISLTISGINFENITGMIRKLYVITVAGMIFTGMVSAQQEEVFKPYGKVEVDIFTNYSSSFAGGENHNKFDIGRAYLGYIYHFSKNFSGRVTYDAGNLSLSKSHFTGFLKFAYLEYRTGNWKISGGMIPPKQFDYANEKWGFRYIYKPIHDEYGFGYSSDMGLCVEHTFNKWLSADIMVSNGESYKFMDTDSTLKTSFGMVIKPFKNTSIRGYYDFMKKGNANQQTFEIIAFYENSRFKLGVNYSTQQDHGLIAGHDYSAVSVNGSLNLKGDKKLWARFDKLTSEKQRQALHPWNYQKDGSLFMTGIEFIPVKGIKMSPNFQGWKPADSGKHFTTRFCLNVDIKV
jgi:hypothetical protein